VIHGGKIKEGKKKKMKIGERQTQRGKEDREKHTSGRAGTSASWPRTSDSRNSANKTSFSPSSSPSSSSLRPFRQPESAGGTKTEGRNSIAIAQKPSLPEASSQRAGDTGGGETSWSGETTENGRKHD